MRVLATELEAMGGQDTLTFVLLRLIFFILSLFAIVAVSPSWDVSSISSLFSDESASSGTGGTGGKLALAVASSLADRMELFEKLELVDRIELLEKLGSMDALDSALSLLIYLYSGSCKSSSM